MMNRFALNLAAASPVPRISRTPYLLGAALLLLVLQLLSGTGAVYALLVFALLVVSYVAISWAGGLNTLFGIIIFYLLLQHILVSQIANVFFWDPADAPLRQPIVTMGVFIVGMASIALGVRMADRFRRRKGPLFTVEARPERLLWISILCTIISSVVALAVRTAGVDAENGQAIQGGVLGPLKQIFFIGPLAIAAGTAYIIKKSGGRHSLGLLNGIPIAVQIAAGALNSTRENMAAPVVVYLLTCIAFRYRFRPKHYGSLLTIAFIANFIIFPYALVARATVHTGNFEKDVRTSVGLLGEIIQDPLKYHDLVADRDAKRKRYLRLFDYYSHSTPTLDRYTNISWDDAVVDATVNQGTTGWTTITPGFEASLPRFINPDKPFLNAGNFLAHREPGLMPNKNDVTTGITMGFFVDAFSSFGWLGISVIPCLIIFCLMTIYRLLIDVHIWGNVVAVSILIPISWGFSEGTVGNMIILCLTGTLAFGVGLLAVYLLADFFYRLTNRVRNSWVAGAHPHRSALGRIVSVNPRVGKLIELGDPTRPENSL